MDPKYIVALELSGSQVRGALATVEDNALGSVPPPTIEAIATERDTDCVQYGRVQNVINAAKATDNVLKKLHQDGALGDGTINSAYIALGGRSLSSDKVTAEITLNSEMVITKEILRSLFIEAAKKAAPNMQVLRVLPRKYVVDSQPIENPEGALGRKIRGEFTLVTCNPTNQRNLELVAADKDRLNLASIDYVVTPLAVADIALDEESKQLGCVLVDVGHHTITISIYKDRALQYLRTLPMGAHSITRDISTGMNWTMEKAEKLKCSDGDAMAEQTRGADEFSRMNAYVAARAYEIVANIRANIDYANYKASDLPAGFLLTGRGSYLNNFDNLLAAQCKMRVRRAQVPAHIKIGISARNVHIDDYMPLVAVVMAVSRKPHFASCVTMPKAPVQEPVAEETTYVPEEEIEKTQVRSATDTRRPQRQKVDEDRWAEDDEDTEKAPKAPKKEKETASTSDTNGKKKRNGFRSKIDILKEKLANIVAPAELDDDAEF